MDAVTGCQGTGPIGGVDFFVLGARWRNEARMSCQLSAFSGQLGWRFFRARLCILRIEANCSIGRRQERLPHRLLLLRNEPTVLL